MCSVVCSLSHKRIPKTATERYFAIDYSRKSDYLLQGRAETVKNISQSTGLFSFLIVVVLFYVVDIIGTSVAAVSDGEKEARVLEDHCVPDVDHLATFAQVATKVRHFDPGGTVSKTDWDQFIWDGVSIIACVDGNDEFLDVLEKLIVSVSPETRFGPDARQPASPLFDQVLYQINWHYGYKSPYESGRQLYFREQRIYSGKSLPAHLASRRSLTTRFENDLVSIDMPFGRPWPIQEDLELRPDLPEAEWRRWQDTDRLDCVTNQSILWLTLKHFFPNEATASIDWNNNLKSLVSGCLDTSIEYAERGFLARLTTLGDNHIRYLGSSAPRKIYAAPYALDLIEGELLAVDIIEGRYELEGIVVGDQILTIDGVDAETYLNHYLSRSLRAENRSRNWAARNALYRKEMLSEVVLEVRRASGETFEVAVRARPGIEASARSFDSFTYSDYPLVQDLGCGLHHVNVSRLRLSDMEKVLGKMRDSAGVIVDLRGYPADMRAWMQLFSHLVEEEVFAAPMYVHVKSTPDHDDMYRHRVKQSIEPAPEAPYAPAVALASRYSASQSEHALLYARAAGIPIVGESTYGVNGNTTRIHTFGGHHRGGRTLEFTGMEVHGVDGEPFFGTGIVPDKHVPVTRAGLMKGEDEQLEASKTELINSGSLDCRNNDGG